MAPAVHASQKATILPTIYKLEKHSGFIAHCFNEEYLLFSKLTGDTILLDAVSFGILGTIDHAVFEHTSKTTPYQLDLNNLNIEDIQEHLHYLMDIGLIQPLNK